MRDWDIDRIIGAGLIFALVLYFIVVLVVTLATGKVLPLDVASNIVTGLIGYMGKSLVDRVKTHKPRDKKEETP